MAYTWTEQTALGSGAWYTAAALEARIIVGGFGDTGNLYLSTDNGANWAINTAAGVQWWYGVTLNGTTGIAACSTNIGSGWTGSGGYIYTSTNNGSTWTEQTAAGQKKWSGIVSSSDGTILYACDSGEMDDGSIYKSTNSGETWTTLTSAGSSGWKNLSCSAVGTKIAVGLGTVKYSTDSGATWQTITGVSDIRQVMVSGDGNSLYAMQGASGGNGYIYKSTDDGSTWSQLTSASQLYWKTIAVSEDGGEIIATFEDNTDSNKTKVRTSIDGGTTWITHTSFTTYYMGVPCPVGINENGTNVIFGPPTHNLMLGNDASLAPIPTEVTGTTSIPNTGGTITLTEDMTVTGTGDLTLEVTEVGDLAGGKIITVQPGGKIKLSAGQQITVLSGTLYNLLT